MMEQLDTGTTDLTHHRASLISLLLVMCRGCSVAFQNTIPQLKYMIFDPAGTCYKQEKSHHETND
jgi:hypothetical protein